MATLLSIDESPLNQGTTNDLSLPSSGDAITALNTFFGNTTWTSSVLQAARKTGALTGLSNTIDLALTNSTGGLLNGVDSGLNDLSGNDILLYTDTNNNNLVLGKVGTTVMFAIYLDATGSTTDQGATGADLWMINFQPIQHNLNGADPNDFVSITGKLYSSVTNPISFDATGAPSGANLFITYGDGTYTPNEVAVVVTAPDAANQSNGENVSSGGVVKTSQAGSNLGGATFGKNSQMLDPPDSNNPAESLYFTFVTGANPNLVVNPAHELSPTEANVESNIQFSAFFGAEKVSFVVSQLQQAKQATLQINAWNAQLNPNNPADLTDDTPWSGVDYIDHQNQNTAVAVEAVTITRVVPINKNSSTTYEWTFTENQSTNVVTIVTKVNGVVNTQAANQPAAFNVTADFSGNSVVLRGMIAGDKILYDTVGTHNRLQITNAGDAVAAFDAAFDIGALKIESGGTTTTLLDPIDIYDDGPDANGTPVTATVDEDGTPLLAGANTNAALGDSNAGSTATGSIAGIFNAGRDGLQTFQLNSVTSGLPQNLTSQGAAVLYDVSGNTLTAYVEVSNANGTGYNATDDREVFTLSLSGTNNSTYLFTLIDQLDHALTDDPTTIGVTETLFEDELTLDLGTILQIKDGDNDVATGDATDFVITLDDDSPVINGSTNLVYSNSLNGAGNPGGTGTFNYSVGVDDRDAPLYSALNTDLLVTLSGFVGNNNNPLTAIDVDWLSETDSQATFEFDFTYISNPGTGATTTLLNNTIVFDKVNDTYTVHLVNPISSFSVLTLADPGVGFSGYVFDSTTPMGGIAGVTTAQLAGSFFVQFKGFAEPSGNGTDSGTAIGGNANLDALALSEPWSHNDDDEWTANELFTLFKAAPNPADPPVLNPAGVSISGESAGTNSDTMQSGEVLDFTLYSGDPKGLLNPGAGVNKTTAATIFIEFDQLGFNVAKQTGEDMVIVLKLVDANNPNITTTRAIIVEATDIYHAGDTLPAGFGFTAEITGNNGLVIIEQQDYNFGGTDNWVIQGAQVLASTEGVTSTSAIDLDRDVGAGGASTQAGPGFSAAADSGNGTTSTWDSDVFKIVNIGFVTNVSPDASLSFGVQVVDRDGDTTASQTLAVSIEADSTFAGTNSADTFVMRDIPADLDLALSQETRTINGFDPAADFLDFTTAGSATNFVDGGTNNTSLANLIANAETALDDPAVIYYFARFGGNGYLAYDGDADGLTALVKLTGVTSGFTFDDII